MSPYATLQLFQISKKQRCDNIIFSYFKKKIKILCKVDLKSDFNKSCQISRNVGCIHDGLRNVPVLNWLYLYIKLSLRVDLDLW